MLLFPHFKNYFAARVIYRFLLGVWKFHKTRFRSQAIILQKGDCYSIEIQCLEGNFSEIKRATFRDYIIKKTYDLQPERRSFKIFLPASFWMFDSFVKSLKIKCVGGLMFCSKLIIGIFCELALACRNLADFEEYIINVRPFRVRYVPIWFFHILISSCCDFFSSIFILHLFALLKCYFSIIWTWQ